MTLPRTDDLPGYSIGDRMVRMEVLMEQHLIACGHSVKAMEALATKIDGRPSWWVASLLGVLTTCFAVTLTLVLSGAAR